MQTLRSWSRRAWLLHGYLIATLALMPALSVRSGWIDTDSDSAKDTWEDVVNNTSHSLSALNAMNADVDGDGAYNDEELAYGSDPFDLDSDDDGLTDGDEIHLANEQAQKGYSLLMWDTNGDEVSDHDDFYGCTAVTYPGGVLPNFPNATYSDYDGDGLKNPFDPYPTDPLNHDADSDSINDDTDPAPGDSANYSWSNGISWGSTALGDNDSDGIINFWDAMPDDSSNGSSDSDNDGLANETDPFPSDYYNYSPLNGISWYGGVFGDEDWDGVSNYCDQWPYDSANGAGGSSSGSTDDDSDGIDNSLDPAPNDSLNFSFTNGTSWYSSALEDSDNDGVANFYDAWPSDRYNGSPDYDSDGFSNDQDPYPEDTSNYSSTNGIYWYGSALGDDDSDGAPNYADTSPYPDAPSDSDSDGLSDAVDPAPYDSSNYSSANGTYWYANALDDADGDFVFNFWDQWPSDSTNGGSGPPDTDSDGIADADDPAPYDSSNYSSYNGIYWFSNALSNADNDSIANFWDSQPYLDENANWDGDAYLDGNDPAPNDYTNYSSINGRYWYNEALNDNDGDGTTNFYDSTPNGAPPPADDDGDGLNIDEENANGTSDSDSDSDDDGLTDYEEVNIFGTNPTNARYLSQQRGWGDLYTDWQLADLFDGDSDDIPDRIEAHYGLNSSWAGDARLDLDNNGLSNYAQYQMGIALNADLDRYDADGDGMSDVFEDYYSPALSKSDPADATLDPDGDGVLNYEEMQLVLSPQSSDTYAAGNPLGDLLVLMTSVRYPLDITPPTTDSTPANNVPDWADAVKAVPAAPDYNHFTRQLSNDLDGDGMPDAWEHKYGRWKYPSGAWIYAPPVMPAATRITTA